jgi:hypothetical protein
MLKAEAETNLVATAMLKAEAETNLVATASRQRRRLTSYSVLLYY